MPAPKLPPSLVMAREALQADDPAGALALLQDMPPKLQSSSNAQVLVAMAHFDLGQDKDALAAIQAARKAGANGQTGNGRCSCRRGSRTGWETRQAMPKP